MIISVVGKAGSGKTSFLVEYMRKTERPFILIQSGEIARRLAETDEETREALARGRIAPPAKMDEAINHELESAIVRAGKSSDVLIDGYPRYTHQAMVLKQHAMVHGVRIVVCKINCDDPTAMLRLLKRRRADDEMESIKARHKFWYDVTEPAIEEMVDTSPRVFIDGSEKKVPLVELIDLGYNMTTEQTVETFIHAYTKLRLMTNV